MPRGKKVHDIFNQFVQSLSALIKTHVAESVNAATTEFFNSRFGVGAVKTAENQKPVRRRRRRGRKPAVKAVVKPVQHQRKRRRRAAAKGPKPVTLSKNGKRIGRPPKTPVEAKPAE